MPARAAEQPQPLSTDAAVTDGGGDGRQAAVEHATARPRAVMTEAVPDAPPRAGTNPADPTTASAGPTIAQAVPAPPLPQSGAPASQDIPAPSQPVLTANASLDAAAPLADPSQVPGRADPYAATLTLPASATPAPAQQISTALLSVFGASSGDRRITLRLQPVELGAVQIRIDRPLGAPARVDITVERPETMTLLLRDQPQLQRALDQAGVPADGRSLTLHVAAPESTGSSGSVHSDAAASADPGQNGGNGAGNRSGGQRQPGDTADPDQDDTSTPLPRWLRAGLDITA